MRKESKIVEEKNLYDVETVIDDIALIKTYTGKTGLIDIKTGKIIECYDNCIIRYYNNKKLFFIEKKNIDKTSKKTYIKIYDALYKRFIVDNWFICNDIVTSYIMDYKLYILQDPITKKYHLLDVNNYRLSTTLLTTEFDNIEILDSSNAYEWFFLVTKGSKKAIYSTKIGFVTPFEYEDIKKCGWALIFTQHNKKFFTNIKELDKKNMSPLFDEIKYNDTKETILYCKNDSNITIYFADKFSFKELFTTPLYDDIKQINEVDNHSGKIEYIFLIKKNNKYGLISGTINRGKIGTPVLRPLVDAVYDKIEYIDGDYYLYKGNKVGLFTGGYKKNYSLEPIYDNIIPIQYSNNYELFIGDICTIYDLFNKITILRNCKIIQNLGSSIIFERNGKKGIIHNLKSDDIHSIEGLDDIKDLGNNYYLITLNGKKGILFNNKILIEPKYESINIKGDFRKNIIEPVYLVLKKPEYGYDLAKCYGNNQIEYLNTCDCNDILLYESIMVLKNDSSIFIYDYNNQLLGTFPLGVHINEIVIKNKYVYKIDDVYYVLRNGMFVRVPIETIELYMSAYESEFGTVVVNSYSLDEHDEKCKSIEECSDEYFDDILIKNYQKNVDIQNRYPTLVKKMNKR